MQKPVLIEEKINELRKKISTLVWDIPNIRNNELKSIQEKKLISYKKELKSLLEE